MANNWPPGHYPMRPEEVLNEEELEELRRSGQALYRDGSKRPEYDDEFPRTLYEQS